MKLLLTSGGITDKAIARALVGLAGKPASKIKVAFVPTAANTEWGDKGWLINDLHNLKKMGSRVDIVDISALPKKIWLPRLKKADVLFFGGGNSFHLIHWMRKSGLAKILPKLLKSRVYAGISAGSMVATKDLKLSQSKKLYYEEIGQYKDERGLGFVNCYIRPHLNSSYFTKVRAKLLKKLAKKISEPIYALDDKTALKIDGKKVQVVGPGKYLVLNA